MDNSEMRTLIRIIKGFSLFFKKQIPTTTMWNTSKILNAISFFKKKFSKSRLIFENKQSYLRMTEEWKGRSSLRDASMARYSFCPVFSCQ